MKKSTIIVPFDDEKLNALQRYAGKEGANITAELDDAVQKIYEKYVPKAVREYFEMRDGEYQAAAKTKPGKAAAKKNAASKGVTAKSDPESAGTAGEEAGTTSASGEASSYGG